jgi:hypothetical protein
MNSRRMNWVGHVARKGEERNCTRFWRENPRERDHLEDGSIERRMRLEWILGGLAGGGGGFTWLRIGVSGGFS